MASVIEWYKDLMTNMSDARVRNWFLMSSPLPVIIIVSMYIYYCTSAGPRYMKNRKPYSLRKVLILHNFIQVVLSIYIMYETLMSGWLNDYNFKCQPMDYSDNPKALRMASTCHLYFVCKLIELLDTVFFVLRKKDRQITVLHLYHHALMPITTWFGVKFSPGGSLTLMVLLNSFVHVVMYSYYMLAALGPEVQKYLWWKKYLTILQLTQFVSITLHTVQMLLTNCAVSRVFAWLIISNALLFLCMFGSFYVETYTNKSTLARQREKQDVSSGRSEKKFR